MWGFFSVFFGDDGMIFSGFVFWGRGIRSKDVRSIRKDFFIGVDTEYVLVYDKMI